MFTKAKHSYALEPYQMLAQMRFVATAAVIDSNFGNDSTFFYIGKFLKWEQV